MKSKRFPFLGFKCCTTVFSLYVVYAGVIAAPLAFSGSPLDADAFIRPTPGHDIYHEGWIDLNKNGECDPYEDRTRDAEERIADLIGRMTIDEKIAQLVTLYGFPRVSKDELPTPAWHNAMWKDGIGNIDEHMNGNTGWERDLADPKYDFPYSLHTRAINEVQRWFVEQTRLGIPVDFTNEGIRGLAHTKATSFPAQLAVSSSWNTDLIAAIGNVTGAEARALGYTNVYSPVLDLARDPRWGRVIETYGEDPFLVGEYGMAQVQGIQRHRVASTLKHYAVYSIPKGGRDGAARTDPHIGWRDVQTIFLHPFRRAVRDAGALGVMASYNDYDGIPIEGSRLFLTDILRSEWGFSGYVVSDSSAVEFIHTKHRVAATPAEAVRQSIEAGLNIRTHFTPPEDYTSLVQELVREGKLSLATIDSRVRDVLRVKYWNGSFDHPFHAAPSQADQIVRHEAHQAVARQAARESIVLLKNEANTLPLDKASLQRVLVTGPLADDAHGWWSRYGAQSLEFITPLAGIRNKLGSNVDVRYVKGVVAADDNFPESDVLKEAPSPAIQAGIDEAVAAARDVDVIIAALGETDELCRESRSRISLDLPGYQEHLLRALHATGKPVVLVLSNGRPLSINWAAKRIPAIVEMWFPGEDGGNAIADVLFGDYNPAGRLPITFPKGVGQIPLNFPAHPGSHGRDGAQVEGPLFHFGHGLSYTTFAYANLDITPQIQGVQGQIKVSFDVTNTGPRAGDEVAQMYLRDDYSSVITFEKVLRGFRRISLQPGETRKIEFTLTPDHLELYNRAREWVVEPGRFTVMVGASSTNILLTGSFDIVSDSVPREKVPDATDRTDPR